MDTFSHNPMSTASREENMAHLTSFLPGNTMALDQFAHNHSGWQNDFDCNFQMLCLEFLKIGHKHNMILKLYSRTSNGHFHRISVTWVMKQESQCSSEAKKKDFVLELDRGIYDWKKIQPVPGKCSYGTSEQDNELNFTLTWLTQT